MAITNDDLYKGHEKLTTMKKETYEGIYRKCELLIKSTSKIGGLNCFYEIEDTSINFGYGQINKENCAAYIINKLQKSNSNIRAEFFEPNIIFIDWRRKEDIEKCI